ncbi:dockerin type I domain-containing protein, partial [Planctomycetota bacterium]
DMDHDGAVDADDVDTLFAAIASKDSTPDYDLNDDSQVDDGDMQALLAMIDPVPGDVNLDGVFDSSDLVKLFQKGHYEDDLVRNSSWAAGDWNGDHEFDSKDLVYVFQFGFYADNA